MTDTTTPAATFREAARILRDPRYNGWPHIQTPQMVEALAAQFDAIGKVVRLDADFVNRVGYRESLRMAELVVDSIWPDPPNTTANHS